MSVLMQFAMFPTDKGESVSSYVSQVLKMIRDSGADYQLTPMNTIVETDTMAEALEVLQKAHDILNPVSDRVYCSANFDIRKNKSGRLRGKIASIEEKIGKVHH